MLVKVLYENALKMVRMTTKSEVLEYQKGI